VSVKKKSLLDSFAVLAWIQDEEGCLEAAEIKAQYPIAYADAFIVATALREEAHIITGSLSPCLIFTINHPSRDDSPRILQWCQNAIVH